MTSQKVDANILFLIWQLVTGNCSLQRKRKWWEQEGPRPAAFHIAKARTLSGTVTWRCRPFGQKRGRVREREKAGQEVNAGHLPLGA